MNDPLKTELDALLTEDERRLKAATSNVLRPLPAGSREECAELLEAQRRTVTVEAHQAFRESIATRPDFDDIDLAVDPLLMDRPPQRRSGKDANRLLSILDELERREG